MSTLKVSKTIKYTKDKKAREATHTVELQYETTTLDGCVLIDLKKLSTSQSYKGDGGGTDSSTTGYVRLTVAGVDLIKRNATYRTGTDNQAVTEFTNKRTAALDKKRREGAKYIYYGAKLAKNTLKYTAHIYLYTGVMNPQTGNMHYEVSNADISVPGTGVVKITGKPSLSVSGLKTPKRGGNGSYVFRTSWKFAKKLLAGTNSRRATGSQTVWTMSMRNSKTKKKKSWTKTRKFNNTSTNDASLNLANVTADNNKAVTRQTFYPYTSWLLTSLSISVRPRNSSGVGPKAQLTRSFGKPKKPSLSAISQNEQTGVVSCTITSDLGEGNAERARTRYVFTVFDSSIGRKGKEVHSDNSSFTSATKALSYNIENRMALSISQYVRVTVEAWNQGFAGDSDHVSRTIHVSWPARPTITSVSVDNDKADSKVTVAIKTNRSTEHPVTRVKLEKLANVTYSSAKRIPGDAEWEPTDIMDDGTCTALSISLDELNTDPGKYSYVRVKAWNTFENIFYLYSTPKVVPGIFSASPTARDDRVTIAAVTPGDDGKSAIVELGWERGDDSNGTQVTWADDANAWRSTSGPNEHEFEWSESGHNITLSDGHTYYSAAILHVNGLTEGTRYFFRARRYMDLETGREYGPYNETQGDLMSTMPVTAPASVVLNAPPFVERGAVPELTWTYDSEATQTHWELVSGETTTTTETDPSTGIETTHTWIDASQAPVIIASGNDAMGSYVPQLERFEEVLAGATGISIAVRVSTGGDMVESEAVTIGIADRPTLLLSVQDLTVQPLEIDAICSTDCDLSMTVYADGKAGEGPDGPYIQANGDTVWTSLLSPEWEAEVVSGEETGRKLKTITVPQTDQLMDEASYHVSARATDRQTGLVSEEVTATFDVDYARKAPLPSEFTRIDAQDEYDDLGRRKRSAIITLVPPENADPSDICDIYRVTQDGPYPLIEGVATDAVVYDEWAPFGDFDGLAYRVVIRTVDGAVAWDDIEYEFGAESVFHNLVRVDYDGGYVELTRNVSVSDSYSKSFEGRMHLDGSTAGYWNAGVSRTGTISGKLIRVYESDEMAMLRSMGRSTAPAMVRTSDGVAYEANVDVPTVGVSSGSAGVAVSLKATEIVPTSYLGTLYEEPETEQSYDPPEVDPDDETEVDGEDEE